MPFPLTPQRSFASLFAALAVFSLLSLPAPAQTPVAAVPDWFVQHIAHQTGRWVTDNSAYRSEQEPFDENGTTTKPAQRFILQRSQLTAARFPFISAVPEYPCSHCPAILLPCV